MKFKKIRNLVKKLVQQMLGNEPFQFTGMEFVRMISLVACS